MSGKVFLDTNVLVYAYVKSDNQKYRTAKEHLQTSNAEFVLSVQVLGELYNALAKSKIEHGSIVSIIDEITLFCDISPIYPRTVKAALALKKRYKFSYWDSLILSSALENNCVQIFSEDMQNGQIIESTLKITDIFKT